MKRIFRTKIWKKDFYGVNYERLRGVKMRYGPEDLSNAKTGVESDAWVEDSDGRLCRM